MRRLAFLLLGLALTGCLGTDVTGPVPPEELTYAPELGVDFATMTKSPTGLYYKDLAVGTEGSAAAAGMTVTVHYTGWLHTGWKFDSSVSRNQPFPFTLGQHEVIPGFEEGIVGMRVGGKRKLVIPSHLGYGPWDTGSIPGNSTLIFDVELLQLAPDTAAAQ